MSALILDAGALIGADRSDRFVVSQLRAAQEDGLELRTNPMVLAQVLGHQPPHKPGRPEHHHVQLALIHPAMLETAADLCSYHGRNYRGKIAS